MRATRSPVYDDRMFTGTLWSAGQVEIVCNQDILFMMNVLDVQDLPFFLSMGLSLSQYLFVSLAQEMFQQAYA
jgi:hypothetical protein